MTQAATDDMTTTVPDSVPEPAAESSTEPPTPQDFPLYGGLTYAKAMDNAKAQYERSMGIARSQIEAATRHLDRLKRDGPAYGVVNLAVQIGAMLREAGMDLKPLPVVLSGQVCIFANPEHITKLRDILGKLVMDMKRLANIYQKPDGDERDYVEIWLKPVKYPSVRIQYVRLLEPDDPCKVEEITRTERQLTCPVKGGSE